MKRKPDGMRPCPELPHDSEVSVTAEAADIAASAPDFVARLVSVNHLETLGFERFLFFPGMLFASTEKWWGKPGNRTSSHEGVDLCFFAGKDGLTFRLDETIETPMILDGTVVHLMDDFFGKTVVTRHEPEASGSRAMLSLYGHLRLPHGLRLGDRIRRGEVFAAIADTSGRSTLVPPHLHMSMAWAEVLPPPDCLTWEMLNQTDRSVFMDPIQLLGVDCPLMPYTESINPFESFIKCSMARY